MNFQKIATVGIEPTTLALLAPRSNQTELYGLLIFILILNINIKIELNIIKYITINILTNLAFENILNIIKFIYLILYCFIIPFYISFP